MVHNVRRQVMLCLHGEILPPPLLVARAWVDFVAVAVVVLAASVVVAESLAYGWLAVQEIFEGWLVHYCVKDCRKVFPVSFLNEVVVAYGLGIFAVAYALQMDLGCVAKA